MLRPAGLLVVLVAALSSPAAPERGSETPADLIVQGDNTRAVATLVRSVGGNVTHELGIINAVGASLTSRQRALLEDKGLVFYEDRPLQANAVTNAIRNVRDEFTQTSYSNNNGTVSWSGSWIERNDDGQPWISDGVSIISDGGNNQRLRLAAHNKGIWRQAAIPSTATGATLTLLYRRANLEAGDSVAVQASANGGTTWTTVGQISGPANDTSYRTASFNFSAFRSARTSVRFMANFTSASEQGSTWPNDAVLLDDIQLAFDGFVPGTRYAALPGVERLHASGINGTGIAVAVIDSGHWSHPKLDNGSAGWMRVMAQYDAIRNVVTAAFGNPPITNDGNGHGTHVASVIASSARDSGGKFLGVAPNAQLLSIKAFDDTGKGRYADVIRAIDWAVANRAAYDIRVLNCSFSGPARTHYWLDPINQAVMRAWQAGIVVVTSAGNRGPGALTLGVPGNVPYVITVGAMSDNVTPQNSSDDFLTSFSSTGPTREGFVKPELLAPGGHVWGMMSASARIARDHPQFRNDGDYFTMSGTSQSTAIVSGVVALMLQHHWLSPDDVKCQLMASSRPALKANGRLAYSVFQQGAGVVDVNAAVYESARGCGNSGMDVAADLAGRKHFAGPARRDLLGRFYLKNVAGQTWDGTYSTSTGFNWVDANLWGDDFIWTDGDLWISDFVWGDDFVWSDDDDDFPWGDSVTDMSVNIWVAQE